MAGFGVRSLFLVAALTVSAPALAAPKVAALVPTLRPSGSNELRDRFHDSVTRGLGAGGVDPVPTGEVRMRLSGSEEQFGCSSAGSCAARAATSLHVEHTVASEVVIAGKDYTIRMKLLDAAGREVGRTEDTCDICTVKEAEEAVTRSATKLVTANRAAIDSAPTSAAPPARTETPPPRVEPPPPARVEHPPAPPPARVEHPAPPPPLVPATPPPQATPSPAVTPPPATVQTERKPFPWRGVAIGSLAAGVVGLAVGIPLLVIDGRYTNCPSGTTDPVHQCKSINSTVGGGAAMTALGVVGLAAAGVSFYFDWKQRHRPAPQVSLVPVQGGGMALLGSSF